MAAMALMVVGCNKADNPESATPGDAAQATEAAHPVSKETLVATNYFVTPAASKL